MTTTCTECTIPADTFIRTLSCHCQMKSKGQVISGNLVVGYSSSLKLRVLGIVLLLSSPQVCSDLPTDSTTTLQPPTVQPQCNITEPRVLQHPQTVWNALKGRNVTFTCQTCDVLHWSVRDANGTEVWHDWITVPHNDGNGIRSSVLTVYSVDTDKRGWQVRCYAGLNSEVASDVASLHLLPTLEETTTAYNETSTGGTSGQSLNSPSTSADRTAQNIAAIAVPVLFIFVLPSFWLFLLCSWCIITWKKRRTGHLKFDSPQPEEDSKGIVKLWHDTTCTMAQPTNEVEMHEADTVTETDLDTGTGEPCPRRRSPGTCYSRGAPTVPVPMKGDPLMEQNVNVKSDHGLAEKPHIDIELQSANSPSPNGDHGMQETGKDIEGEIAVASTSTGLIHVPRNASSVSLSSLPVNRIPPQESPQFNEDR